MSQASSMRPLKIIVVDDDPTTLDIVRALLEDQGHEVSTREEAIGTTAQIRDEQPDYVLLDVRMPALSGERVAQILNRDNRLEHTRLIFHSARPPDELAALAAENEAAGWIHKDGNHQTFLEKFEKIVSESPVSEEMG